MKLLRQVRALTGATTGDLARAMNITHARAQAYIDGKRRELLSEHELIGLKLFVEDRLSNLIQVMELLTPLTTVGTSKIKREHEHKQFHEGWSRDKQRGEVEFIYCVILNDRVKIGMTTRPEIRKAEYDLHNGKAGDFQVLGRGDRKVEAAIHAALQPYHIFGEWYLYVSEVKKLLATL